jgi:hypothetical protein
LLLGGFQIHPFDRHLTRKHTRHAEGTSAHRFRPGGEKALPIVFDPAMSLLVVPNSPLADRELDGGDLVLSGGFIDRLRPKPRFTGVSLWPMD